MQPSISYLTLGVNDLQRARRFYQSMGWAERPESKDYVAFFSVNDFVFALYSLENLSEDACFEFEPDARPKVVLSHNVSSAAQVDELLKKAVASGAELLRTPGVSQWGLYRGYFADTEGLVWEVCYNHKKPLGAPHAE